MDALSLEALGNEHLEKARTAASGRSAHTIFGGQEHRLRQTMIALAAGRRLGEHASPGAATLQVLRGHVRLHAGETNYDAGPGELLIIPPQRHDLEAVEDAVVLLTVGLAG